MLECLGIFTDGKSIRVELPDIHTASIMIYYREMRDFIQAARAGGGKVLIHDNAGISQSGALLIAYIMETQSRSFADAFRIVQLKRFCVSPNEGFQAQLLEFEPIYRAMQGAAADGSEPARLRKRGIDEEDEVLLGERDPGTFGSLPPDPVELPGHAVHANAFQQYANFGAAARPSTQP